MHWTPLNENLYDGAKRTAPIVGASIGAADGAAVFHKSGMRRERVRKMILGCARNVNDCRAQTHGHT